MSRLLVVLVAWLAIAFAANAQTGSLSTDGQCTIPTGGSTCSVNFQWNTTGASYICLWDATHVQVFTCQGYASYSGTFPNIGEGQTTLELRAHDYWPDGSYASYANSINLSATTVQGIRNQPPPISGTLTSDSQCTIAETGTYCSVNYQWNTTNVTYICLWDATHVQVSNCQGYASYSATFNYIAEGQTTLELRAHNNWPDGSYSSYATATSLAAVTVTGIKQQPQAIACQHPVSASASPQTILRGSTSYVTLTAVCVNPGSWIAASNGAPAVPYQNQKIVTVGPFLQAGTYQYMFGDAIATIQVTAPPTNDVPPIGTMTSFDGRNIEGWACDPNLPNTPISVVAALKIHSIDPDSRDDKFGPMLANIYRADVAQSGQCYGYGGHGFRITLPDSLPSGRWLLDGTQKFINIVAANNNDLSIFSTPTGGTVLSLANPNIVLVDTRPDRSTAISHSFPSSIATPGSYPISMTFQNIGPTTWLASSYLLCPSSPGIIWPFSPTNLPSDVPPGGQITLTRTDPNTYTNLISVPALLRNMSHRNVWNVCRRGQGDVAVPFGQTVDVTTTLLAAPKSALFVSQTSIPTSIKWGQAFRALITFQNTGSLNWPKNETIRLVPMAYDWRFGEIKLPSDVGPGSTVTFDIWLRAPDCPSGSNCTTASVINNFAWSLSLDGTPFGSGSTTLAIRVGPGALATAPPGPPPDFAPLIIYPAYANF